MARQKYELKVNAVWSEVDWYIFRSWNGERRINGLAYVGPVYYLGTTVRSDNG
jgi:hypothetical protein